MTKVGVGHFTSISGHFFHYEKIIRFNPRHQLPGAGRTRAWLYHGSDMPTSRSSIYVLKSANVNDLMPSVYV